MVLCFRRITPGYIRLLQIQVSSNMKTYKTDITMKRASILLGVSGVWISSYSPHRMLNQKRITKRSGTCTLRKWTDLS